MHKNKMKTIAISMSAILCLSMAGCSKKESADTDGTLKKENPSISVTQSTNEEYGYNVEVIPFSQLKDSLEQVVTKDDTMYFVSSKFDEMTMSYTYSVQNLSISNPETITTYATYQSTNTDSIRISGLWYTEEGNVSFFKTETTYTQEELDASLNAKLNGETYSPDQRLDIGDTDKNETISEEYIQQFGVNLSDLELTFADIEGLTVGEFADLYNRLISDSSSDSHTKVFFVILAPDGTEVSSIEVSDKFTNGTIADRYTCKDGKYYFPGQYYNEDPTADTAYNLSIFDTATCNLEEIPSTGLISTITQTQNGTIAVSTFSDNGDLCITTFDDAGKCFSDKSNPVSVLNITRFYPGTGNMIYYTDDSSLHTFDLSSGEDTTLLRFMDYSIQISLVSNIFYEDETHFSIILPSIDAATTATQNRFHKVPIDQVEEQNVVTLGSVYPDQSLKDLIVTFNSSHSEFKIQLIQYMDEGDFDFDAATAQLNQDILSGNAPDLIECSSLDFTPYAAKGILEDLSTYLANDTDLNTRNLNTHILDLFKLDGKQYLLPPAFTLNFLSSPKNVLGDYDGFQLSFDKFLSVLESNPETEIFESTTNDFALSQFFASNQTQFINYSAGTCNFTDGNFEKLLTAANYFPSEDDTPSDPAISTPVKLANGELLFYKTSLYDLQEYSLSKAILENQCNITGMPTLNADSGTAISPSGPLFAINSASTHKDESWEFLKALFLNTNTGASLYTGLPIDNDSLNLMFERAMETSTSMVYQDDLEVNIPPLTADDVAVVRGLIDSSQYAFMPYVTSDVADIISEEAKSYFQGDKSAAEVCKLIQSRVDILINESK